MSSALKTSSAELLFVGSADASEALPELSDVILAADVTAEDGLAVPAGSHGTVVAVLGGGEAYIVEFTSPRQVLATLQAAAIRLT